MNIKQSTCVLNTKGFLIRQTTRSGIMATFKEFFFATKPLAEGMQGYLPAYNFEKGPLANKPT